MKVLNIFFVLIMCFVLPSSAQFWEGKRHKHPVSVPYVPQPDAPQQQASTDRPAAMDSPLQQVLEWQSSLAENSTSIVAPRGSAVRASKGSILSIEGITGQHLYDVAMQNLGRAYRSGATGPRAFDCSGFTSFVYRALNILLSRSSREQFLEGVPVQRDELRVGDLVFFARGGQRGRINHVGMVCEVMPNGNFKFVHACSRGVSIDDFGKMAYYQSRYVGARRIIQ